MSYQNNTVQFIRCGQAATPCGCSSPATGAPATRRQDCRMRCLLIYMSTSASASGAVSPPERRPAHSTHCATSLRPLQPHGCTPHGGASGPHGPRSRAPSTGAGRRRQLHLGRKGRAAATAARRRSVLHNKEAAGRLHQAGGRAAHAALPVRAVAAGPACAAPAGFGRGDVVVRQGERALELFKQLPAGRGPEVGCPGAGRALPSPGAGAGAQCCAAPLLVAPRALH
jgi:hypothetical protein